MKIARAIPRKVFSTIKEGFREVLFGGEFWDEWDKFDQKGGK